MWARLGSRGATAAVAVLGLSVTGLTSAAVAEVRWTPPQQVSAAGTYIPQLLMSADGTRVTGVWSKQYDDPLHRVRVQTASAVITDTGAEWSAPHDLSLADEGEECGWPSMAMSRDGRTALVAWGCSVAGSGPGDPGLWGVWVATARVDGSEPTWSRPQKMIGYEEAGSARAVAAALSEDGTKAAVLWSEKANIDVEAPSAVLLAEGQVSGAQSTWGIGELVKESPHYVGLVDLAMSADGDTALAVINEWPFGPDEEATASAFGGKRTGGALVLGDEHPLQAQVGTGKYGPAVDLSRSGETGLVVWGEYPANTDLQQVESGSVQSEAVILASNGAQWPAGPTAVAQSPLAAVEEGLPLLRTRLSADGTAAAVAWTGGDLPLAEPQTAVEPQTEVLSVSGVVSGTAIEWGTATRFADASWPSLAQSDDGSRLLLAYSKGNVLATTAGVQRVGAAVEPTQWQVAVVQGEASGVQQQWGAPVELGRSGQPSLLPGVAAAADGGRATAAWTTAASWQEPEEPWIDSATRLLPPDPLTPTPAPTSTPTPTPTPTPTVQPPAAQSAPGWAVYRLLGKQRRAAVSSQSLGAPDRAAAVKVRSRTLVRWGKAAGATGYRVTVRGTTKCRTTAAQRECVVSPGIGKGVTVKVRAVGAAGSSAPVAAKYVHSRPAVVGTVRFGPDSAQLVGKQKRKVRQYAAKLAQRGFTQVVLDGFTAQAYQPGSPSFRKRLSQRRARAVEKVMRAKWRSMGVTVRVKVRAFGAADPVADNDTGKGRAKNRRATINIR